MQVRIHYLQHHQINKARWDKCIEAAANALVYPCSYYLDAMASHWDALVLDDYTMVMPLPWRKKAGIYYLYQPPFTAQLGVFGQAPVDQVLPAFLSAVPKKFRYWDFSLNSANLNTNSGFPIFERSNYVLDLNKSYNELYAGYRDNVKRNIRRAASNQCSIKADTSVDEVIAMAAQQAHGITPNDLARFKQLTSFLENSAAVRSYGVVSSGGQLVASAVFIIWQQRAYYLLVGNHPNGRTLGASHLLIDSFIKDHAGSSLTLDFEGSDIRNLAFFYSSFGATEERYPAIRLNRLPWYLRWLKN